METVVTSFTALVTAVLLFYFGSRTLENIRLNNGTGSNAQTPEEKQETGVGAGEIIPSEKETTVENMINTVISSRKP